MQAIGFYLLLPILYFFSILPLPLLYLFSDVVYFPLYYIFRYRREVVHLNLKNSFPGKNKEELITLEKEYYHHLCDLVIESVKALTISSKEINQRCKFLPGAMEIFRNLYQENKNVIVMMGHFGNWEWAGLSMSNQSPYLLQVTYRPLSNKKFDQLFLNLRSRFGAKPVTMNDTYREMMRNKEKMSCTVFIADQTPPSDSVLWIYFLNQDTLVFRGAERIARKMNLPVLYASVKKIKRGYYGIRIEDIAMNPSLTKEDEITHHFNTMLEKDIIGQPFNWLWSHRRWKHRKNVKAHQR